MPDLEAASGDGLTEVWESFAVAGRVWAFGRVAARFAGATFGRSKKNFAKRNSNFSFTVCVYIPHERWTFRIHERYFLPSNMHTHRPSPRTI